MSEPPPLIHTAEPVPVRRARRKFTSGRLLLLSLALWPLLLASGCRHSAFVETTIANEGSEPVTLIEVNYPSASFGTGALAPHSEYHYRFKIQGSGVLRVQFTDSTGHLHTWKGPELDEGQTGTLRIVIGPGGNVGTEPHLSTPK